MTKLCGVTIWWWNGLGLNPRNSHHESDDLTITVCWCGYKTGLGPRTSFIFSFPSCKLVHEHGLTVFVSLPALTVDVFFSVRVCIFAVISSLMPDVSIPVMPITDFVFQDMKKFGDRPALVSQYWLLMLYTCVIYWFVYSLFICSLD